MLSPAQAIRQEGSAILRGVLPSADVEAARERCLVELGNRKLWFAGGTIAGHIAYTLPPDLDIVAKLLTNSAVVSCISEILGSDFQVLSVGCNVNLPGSVFQPAHADGNMDCDYLALNLPLGEVTETNGSAEVFAGTHRTKLTYVEFMRACRNDISRRANTHSGDVILRYPNLWHRGTPNRSGVPRFMIAALLGKPSASGQSIRLSPENIKAIERAGVRASMIATDERTGEFRPTYFQRTPRGIAREVVWRYAPPLYNLLRRLE